jgi:hypothetical protein
MSQQFDESYGNPPENDQQPNPVNIQSLRDAAERGRKLEPKVANLERENAFLRAGIDPDDTSLKYFYRGYDGELNPDAIKAAAIEAGFVAPPPPDPAVQAHQQGQGQVQAASAGTEAAYDPAGAVYAMQQAMAEGGVEAMMAAGRTYGLPVANGR